jgi:hypothetical protein
MNVLITERPSSIPLRTACHALALNRSSVYARRRRASESATSRVSRKTASQPRALVPEERRRIHDILSSAEFCNQPPAEVYHTLLERGVYLCLVSTLQMSYATLKNCVNPKNPPSIAAMKWAEAACHYKVVSHVTAMSEPHLHKVQKRLKPLG